MPAPCHDDGSIVGRQSAISGSHQALGFGLAGLFTHWGLKPRARSLEPAVRYRLRSDGQLTTTFRKDCAPASGTRITNR
jgi:hypothetical protein